jgi:4-hydroxyphenylacetate 3-monooxygenase
MTSNTMDTVSATHQPTPTRPMTGAEYLESLRDGREIWLYGERVKDVTTHPAFRNTARMVARLYDALHDPALQEVLTMATDTGSGGYTHRYFRAPMNWEEQLAARDAIAAWARLTYGWLGRVPDIKRRFLAPWGRMPSFMRRMTPTPGSGTRRRRSRCSSSTMPSFIPRWIGIALCMSALRCACTW